MANNNLLYNAAFSAVCTSASAGTLPIGATPAALVAAATAFATALDTAIVTDGTISGGGGVTLPPTTAAITAAQAFKTQTLRGLVGAAFAGRYTQATTGYGPLVSAIAAEYAAVIAGGVLG